MRSTPPFVAQRKFARTPLMLAVLAVVVTNSAVPIAAEPNWEKAKDARQQALAKRRRIFFNDDTYELDREDADDGSSQIDQCPELHAHE